MQGKASMYKSILIWLLIGMSILLLFNLFNVPQKSEKELIFSDFVKKVDSGEVDEVTIKESNITGRLKDGSKFKTYSANYPDLIKELRDKNVRIIAKPPDQPPLYMTILISWGPIIFIVLFWRGQLPVRQLCPFSRFRALILSRCLSASALRG